MPPTFPHTASISPPAWARSSSTSSSIAFQVRHEAIRATLFGVVQVLRAKDAAAHAQQFDAALGERGRGAWQRAASRWPGPGRPRRGRSSIDPRRGIHQRFLSLLEPSSDSCSNSWVGEFTGTLIRARAQASPNTTSVCDIRRLESSRSARMARGNFRLNVRRPRSLTRASTAVTTSGPRRAPSPFSSAPTRNSNGKGTGTGRAA